MRAKHHVGRVCCRCRSTVLLDELDDREQIDSIWIKCVRLSARSDVLIGKRLASTNYDNVQIAMTNRNYLSAGNVHVDIYCGKI